MATYKDIEQYIRTKYGYVPKPCWIAHMKELCGLNPRMAYNRQSPNSRMYPCPIDKQADLIEAFRHFKMIE